jgi:hypothetical protein
MNIINNIKKFQSWSLFHLGVLIIDLTRPYQTNPTWSKDKWIGYMFNFFDSNRDRSGPGQLEPDPINYIFWSNFMI